jgi:hypothetical protein
MRLLKKKRAFKFKYRQHKNSIFKTNNIKLKRVFQPSKHKKLSGYDIQIENEQK